MPRKGYIKSGLTHLNLVSREKLSTCRLRISRHHQSPNRIASALLLPRLVRLRCWQLQCMFASFWKSLNPHIKSHVSDVVAFLESLNIGYRLHRSRLKVLCSLLLTSKSLRGKDLIGLSTSDYQHPPIPHVIPP